MKYLVTLTLNAGTTPEQMKEFAISSTQVIWGLYVRDIVREMHVREDKKGIVLMMEAPSPEALAQALALIPWVTKDLVKGEGVRLMPFPELSQAFIALNQQAA